jgi:hypothetical protein
MRIRTIKPEFFTHEGLQSAELEEKLPLRLAYIGLWCAADREGRFKLEPRRLGVQILPYDQVEFSRVLHALATRGFVVLYTVGDACFGCIPSFERHQIVNNRESRSLIPDMDSEGADKALDEKKIDACLTRASRQKDACTTPAKRKGREGNGKDGPSATGEKVDEKPPRQRNEILDALVSVCGGDPIQTTSAGWSQAAKALSDIRQVCPTVAPEILRQKADAYRKAHPDWDLTTSALAKHWGTLSTATTTQDDWMAAQLRAAYAEPVVIKRPWEVD